MVENQDVHYCILCGEAFLPSGPEDVRCPEHGGEGELYSPDDSPQDLSPDSVPQKTLVQDQEAADEDSVTTISDTKPQFSEDLSPETENDSQKRKTRKNKSGIPQNWEVGDQIMDLYEVDEILGEGGSGVVHRVHHKKWGIDLAVKSPVFHIGREQVIQGMMREADIWLGLDLHPHIVTCHYVQALGGYPRLFLEPIEGGSFRDALERGSLHEGQEKKILKRLLDLAVQTAWGLDYLHENRIIHQNVKPGCLLLTQCGTAKITDFGLAGRAPLGYEKTSRMHKKEEFIVKGKGMTPAYCSPEQVEGAPLTLKTDLWSWGLTMLALFAGEMFWSTNFGGLSAKDSLNHYLENRQKGEGVPRMPGGLVHILKEIFQEDPGDRPTDMGVAAQRVIEIYEEELGERYFRDPPDLPVQYERRQPEFAFDTKCMDCDCDLTRWSNMDGSAEEFSQSAVYLCRSCAGVLKESGLAYQEGKLPPISHLISGQRIHGYIVLREIEKTESRGAYLTWKPYTKRVAVLKVLFVEQDNWYGREFFSAMKIMESLRHPNILRFYKKGEWGGKPVYFHEYVPDGDLYQFISIDGQPLLDINRSVRIIARALEGLAYFHTHPHQYVHRDIQPESIRVLQKGELWIPKLTNFLLAESTKDREEIIKARAGFEGTSIYIPPEQITDYANCDPPTDIYAMGTTLYYLLTGQVPLDLPPPWKIMYHPEEKVEFDRPISRTVVEDERIPIQERRPDLPDALARVVDKAVRKEAEKRYQTAQAFREALLGTL